MSKIEKPSANSAIWAVCSQARISPETLRAKALKEINKICGTLADDKAEQADDFSKLFTQLQNGEIEEIRDADLSKTIH